MPLGTKYLKSLQPSGRSAATAYGWQKGRKIAILAAVIALTYLAEVVFDLNEMFDEFLEKGEGFQLDALFVGSITFLFALLALKISDLGQEAVSRRRAEQAALKLAFNDPLTRIGNRRRMEDALAAVPAGEARAVLLLDLDDFKPINDVFGHAMGDKVLAEAAQRLLRVCGDTCLVCRFGGDEFAVLTEAGTDSASASILARAIALAFEAPFLVDQHDFRVLTSIGVSLFTAGEKSGADALREADVALYRAKEDRQSDYQLFEQGMEDEVRRRSTLERKLRKAIQSGAVQPHFQPLVDLKSSEVIGFEALARWNDPQIGPVSPAEFVALAEETGLITELSEHLMRAACREAAKWPKHLRLSFNLSPKQLKDKLIGLRILAILNETGLPPQRLEIEVTESSLVEDKERAQHLLASLRQAGVRIAIDDFGTGYSSLYHLKEFRSDNLKIDRSFVMSMERGNENEVIVDTILQLAKGLGLVATAEGIETEAHLAKLVASGCQQGQGYLFGKAVSGADVMKLIDELAPEKAVA